MSETPRPNYQYEAMPVRTIDGDTVLVDVVLGFGVTYRTRIRILGVNTPETHSTDPTEKKAGLEAQVRLARFLGCPCDKAGGPLEPHAGLTLKIKGPDKYGGRWLAHVYQGHVDVGQWLIDQKLGVPYDGGARDLWPENPFETPDPVE